MKSGSGGGHTYSEGARLDWNSIKPRKPAAKAKNAAADAAASDRAPASPGGPANLPSILDFDEATAEPAPARTEPAPVPVGVDPNPLM